MPSVLYPLALLIWSLLRAKTINFPMQDVAAPEPKVEHLTYYLRLVFSVELMRFSYSSFIFLSQQSHIG